jgi:two-component system CheB/CheR fusion protein
VIVGRLDVLNDAPISRLSLLSCRNTLMYFNAETQAQVIERFHFALGEEGLLLLGKAETLTAHGELFEPIDRRHRIFRRLSSPRARGLTTERVPTGAAADRVVSSLQAAALDAVPIPALLIDPAGVLVEANEPARQLFGIAPRDYGQPFQDLEISYRPTELRGPIAQAYAERRTIRITTARMPMNGGPARMLDVFVVPLYQSTNAVGAAVFFDNVTMTRELEEQLRQSTEELEEAYQEVQSTNEELETTNEELQSTIEELETTNEELQSTNEELETMNEELQSTNDELHVVNEELRLRSDEIDDLNHFLQAILTSFGGGVVVVDTQRRVRVWNSRAEDLWGLREDEVRGVDVTTIDIGLPVARLASPLKEVLDSADSVPDLTVDAITRRGKSVQCRLSFTPLRSHDRTTGAILVMDVDDPQ